MIRARIISSMWSDHCQPWHDEVTVVDPRVRSFWRHQWALRRAARTASVAVLLGSTGFSARYRDLVSALVIKTLPRRRRPAVVFADATWDLGSDRALGWAPARLSAWMARRAIAVLDSPRTHYCVLSTVELARFSEVWGITPQRVHFTAFPCQLSDADLAASQQPASGADVFAGGNSGRDYPLLVAAAQLGSFSCQIATSHEVVVPAPASDRISVGWLPQHEYMQQTGAAKVIAIPLRYDRPRSAGQQTYLAAARLGKAIVVNDAPGVRDYLSDAHAKIVPNGDAHAFSDAIEWCLSEPAAAQKMAEQARTHVTGRFTIDAYFRELLAVAKSAMP